MAVDGTFNITAKALIGKMEGTLVVHTDGDEVTGTLEGMNMTGEIKDGKINGDKFTCTLVGNGDKGKLSAEVKGQIVDSDHIEGSLKSGLISVKFTGVRA